MQRDLRLNGGKRTIHVFNSYFWRKMGDAEEGYQSVRRFTKPRNDPDGKKRVDVFAMEAVFFPINLLCHAKEAELRRKRERKREREANDGEAEAAEATQCNKEETVVSVLTGDTSDGENDVGGDPSAAGTSLLLCLSLSLPAHLTLSLCALCIVSQVVTAPTAAKEYTGFFASHIHRRRRSFTSIRWEELGQKSWRRYWNIFRKSTRIRRGASCLTSGSASRQEQASHSKETLATALSSPRHSLTTSRWGGTFMTAFSARGMCRWSGRGWFSTLSKAGWNCEREGERE